MTKENILKLNRRDELHLNPGLNFIPPEKYSDFGVYNHNRDDILLSKSLIEDLSKKKEL